MQIRANKCHKYARTSFCLLNYKLKLQNQVGKRQRRLAPQRKHRTSLLRSLWELLSMLSSKGETADGVLTLLQENNIPPSPPSNMASHSSPHAQIN